MTPIAAPATVAITRIIIRRNDSPVEPAITTNAVQKTQFE